MTIAHLTYGVWAAWAVSWFVSARWADRPVGGPGARAELPYRLVTAAGAVLLFCRRLAPEIAERVSFPLPAAFGYFALAVVLGGLGFAWWARIHLGRLWSGRVTKKAAHRVITTGPYAIVRHPIYTGVIAALFAMAVVQQNAVALAGVGVMTLGFFLKARLEEKFLGEELGPEFETYRRRVPMLIPFVRPQSYHPKS